jgi:molecular chaperone GrpE
MSNDDRFVVRDRRFWADPEPAIADPPPAAPASPPVDVERLRTALAELEDAKLRVQRDAERQRERLSGEILTRLLPILDNLERSFSVDPARANAAQVIEGVKLVHGQLLGTLADFGLERRSAIGQRFDPRVHDAVAVVPVSDAAKDGVVVAEAEPAYVVGDRVVRPAKVSVGRASRPPS